MKTYVITAEDHERITRFLESYPPFLVSEQEQITLLRNKLKEAVIVPETNVAGTVVTMDTTVKVVDMNRREAETFRLVYPPNVSSLRQQLSLLSPLGTALLGCVEGSDFECSLPEGTFTFAIKEILYQPQRESRSRR